jgi:hypothetical protein
MHLNTRRGIAAIAIGMSSCLIGGMSPASASSSTGEHTAAAISTTKTGQEITVQELADYLRSVQADKLIDAEGQFDRASAEAAFGKQFADSFQAAWQANVKGGKANAPGLPATGVSTSLAAAKGDSYASCLLKGVGLGGLGGASAAIVDKLKDKKWTDAAKLITKEAAKRGVKIGVKGGVAGLAAALGAFAVWCATPWG